MDTGFELPHRTRGAFQAGQRAGMTDQDVERVVIVAASGQFGEPVHRLGRGRQEACGQLSARSLAFPDQRGVAIVGQRREASVACDAHPGTAFLEVTAGQDVAVGPESGGGGRAGEELVPIGGDHQRVVGMRPPGDEDEAHRRVQITS